MFSPITPLFLAAILATAQAHPSPAPVEKRAAIPVCLAACTLACLALPPPADAACEVSCLVFCLGSVQSGQPITSVDPTAGTLTAANGTVVFTAGQTA